MQKIIQKNALLQILQQKNCTEVHFMAKFLANFQPTAQKTSKNTRSPINRAMERRKRKRGQQLTTINNNCERERVVNHTAKQIVRATREKKNNKEKRSKKENKKRKVSLFRFVLYKTHKTTNEKKRNEAKQRNFLILTY